MTYGFHAYIDESGCEGGDHGKGGSEWFSLSAVVAPNEQDFTAVFNRFNEITKKARGYRFKKYQKLDSKRKVIVSRCLGDSTTIRVAHILVHKPSMTDTRILRDHSRLYRYAGRFLFERISWICRDATPPPERPLCRVTFSERRGFNYDDIISYLRTLQGDRTCRIESGHLHHEHLFAQAHSATDGCRLADVAASAITQAAEYTDHQITDDRPIRELVGVTYRPTRSGKIMGNGIKVFPRNALDLIETEPRFAWLRDHYE